MPRATIEPMPVATARRMLLHGAGLAAEVTLPATPARLRRLIEQLGFVQVDTINVIERAHHLILRSRMEGYDPLHLKRLLERDRSLFEHWTHDASIIPTVHFSHWKHRFARYAARDPDHSWWSARLGGDPPRILDFVRRRIELEGPLMSRDFERPDTGPRGDAWWNWKPAKAALEHLWRCGEIMVARREGFQKVYDLSPRVLPDHHAAPASEAPAHVDWACRSALERLGVATPKEIAAFWRAISIDDARRWCIERLADREIVEVEVQSADGSRPARSVTWRDWKRRSAQLPEAPRGVRILCPFDPVLRDRQRARRLFAFDYRFEAFVPAAKRTDGYYVMAILEDERLIGRFDPKFDREKSTLRIRGLRWEATAEPTRARQRGVANAIESLASWLGAERVEAPNRSRKGVPLGR